MILSEADRALNLFGRLNAAERSAALRFMEFLLLDPVARAAATAQPDPEDVTSEDARRLQEGESWFEHRAGKGIPMDEVLAGFGLKLEDFPPASE